MNCGILRPVLNHKRSRFRCRYMNMPEAEKKVLLVDDELKLQKLMALQLKNKGLGVTVAGNGIEGLAAFRQDQFDLVLSDIMMPELNGMDMVRELKKIDPHVKALMMTGYDVDQSAHSDLDANIIATLEKPFEFAEVFPIIEQNL